MSVVILKWNPGFSSYTMVRFLNHLEKCVFSNGKDVGMNWSIWDYKRVHKEDKFYMLKVGYGQTGIVAAGTITSEPYADEDWAWRNRPTQYCDFDYEVMINPDAYPLLDSTALLQGIPDFDWKGGHSGVVLTEEQGVKFEAMWKDYLQRQKEYFDKASDHNLFMSSTSDVTDNLPYSMRFTEDYNDYEVIIEFETGKIVNKIVISNYERLLGKFGVKSWRALRMLFRENYPDTAGLQTLCGDLFRNQIAFNTYYYKPSDD
ncbi:MAG: hypothetical protein NC097_08025 [Clostridium sp.]|nr:hypothetical protein [Prevotella sp.]MCM1429723.1 hypothetical protein [Clostridium sp.]MCM1476196.1 hypothetical protein [Muribaculaceae bacterium]